MKKILNQPTSAFISVTLNCNSHCIMCDIWKTKSVNEIKPHVYEKLPTSLKSIDITGGEPFLRKDLPEIIQSIKKTCPKAKILITSNGLLTNSIKSIVPKLLKIDKDIAFRISLDSLGKLHDKIRGISKSFIKVKESLSILKQLGVKNIGIIFTLMDINKNSVKDVLFFCKKQHINFSLNLVYESPIYFGQKHLSLRPNNSVIKDVLESVSKHFLLSTKPQNFGKAWFYKKLYEYVETKKRPIPCGAGSNFFYLDPQANIYMCHLMGWKIGNLRKNSFEKIWNSDARKKYLENAKKCNKCFMVCTAKDEIKKRKMNIVINEVGKLFKKF